MTFFFFACPLRSRRCFKSSSVLIYLILRQRKRPLLNNWNNIWSWMYCLLTREICASLWTKQTLISYRALGGMGLESRWTFTSQSLRGQLPFTFGSVVPGVRLDGLTFRSQIPTRKGTREHRKRGAAAKSMERRGKWEPPCAVSFHSPEATAQFSCWTCSLFFFLFLRVFCRPWIVWIVFYIYPIPSQSCLPLSQVTYNGIAEKGTLSLVGWRAKESFFYLIANKGLSDSYKLPGTF